MDNNLGSERHAHERVADWDKNPRKFKKLRQRCSALEARVHEHQSESVQMVAALLLVQDDAKAIAEKIDGGTLRCFIEQLLPQVRQKIRKLLSPSQRSHVEEQMAGAKGVQEKLGESAFEELIVMLWKRMSQIPTRKNQGSQQIWYDFETNMTDRLLERAGEGDGNDIDRFLAQIIRSTRAVQDLLQSKEKRVQQLEFVKGKRKRRRSRSRSAGQSLKNGREETTQEPQEIYDDVKSNGKPQVTQELLSVSSLHFSNGAQSNGYMNGHSNGVSSEPTGGKELHGGIGHVPFELRK